MILTIHRHVIARIPRFGITYDSQKTWLLHVKGAQPEDRGYYMCQVNTNPMISQVGYLQVVGEYAFIRVMFRFGNIPPVAIAIIPIINIINYYIFSIELERIIIFSSHFVMSIFSTKKIVRLKK